jgi:hypothetical protein
VVARAIRLVLVASIVVFVIDLDSIAFASRFVSAPVSTILFAIVFGSLVHFGYESVQMSVATTPAQLPPKTAPRWWMRSGRDEGRVCAKSRRRHGRAMRLTGKVAA